MKIVVVDDQPQEVESLLTSLMIEGYTVTYVNPVAPGRLAQKIDTLALFEDQIFTSADAILLDGDLNGDAQTPEPVFSNGMIYAAHLKRAAPEALRVNISKGCDEGTVNSFFDQSIPKSAERSVEKTLRYLSEQDSQSLEIPSYSEAKDSTLSVEVVRLP